MRFTVASLGAWCLAGSVMASAQAPPLMPLGYEMVTPSIPGVVAAGMKVQFIHAWDPKEGGEGPIAMPDGSVLFTMDNPFRIGKIDRDGKFSVYLQTQPTRILALGSDTKGRLLGTQRFPSALVVLTPAKSSVVVDKFEGKPLEGPNDIVADMKGGVYFTDPTANREGNGPPPPPATGKNAVYYLNPGGQLVLASEAFPRPNGITLSPDGKVAYVGGTAAESLMAFDVQVDGKLTNPRNFGKLSEKGQGSGADGLAMDAAGRVYVAANTGIQVLSPQGQLLGTIGIPYKPRNITFFGPDKKSLFVVTRGAAYKIAMEAEGPKGRAK